MAPRSTMTALVARVKALCNGDTTISDDTYQEFLDDHAVVVAAYLESRYPAYLEHVSPFESLETGATCKLYAGGSETALIETTDYTADYQRGIFTTAAAERRGLRIVAKAYDIHAAAADGWERIAMRYSLEFDFSDVEGSYKRSQQIDMCLKLAAKERAKAWAIAHTVERADTPPLENQQAWNAEVMRRAKAGY
jgi:hypothetical protein